MKENVEIKKLGINGEGIGYRNNKITFIPNALPNEIVEVKNIEENKGYCKAEVEKIIKTSPDRVQPKCKIYNGCQVCSIMPLKYDKQIQEKKALVFESIYKYSKTKITFDKVVKADDPYHYRNSIKLPFYNLKDKLAIGIHYRDTNHYVYLNDCLVQKKEINDTVKSLLTILDKYRYRAYDRKTKIGLRYLLVRSFGNEIMITLVVGKNTKIIDEAVVEIMKIKNVISLNQTTNTKGSNEIIVEPIKNIAGKKSIEVPFADFTFKLSPESFMQLNSAQALKLYEIVKEYLGKNNKMVLDLYCGVGSITCFVNECSQNLIGIELNKQAIKDAKENAKKHRLDNIKFVAGDVDEKIKTYAKNKDVDAIIVDPPRTGLSEYTIESIIKSKTKKLIYVSCNPSTLGKDLSLLQRNYQIEKISIVDMFPNTMHIETIVLLHRR